MKCTSLRIDETSEVGGLNLIRLKCKHADNNIQRNQVIIFVLYLTNGSYFAFQMYYLLFEVAAV